MFKLNDRISIRVNYTEVTGTLVGIDRYEMENFAGKKCRWPSYTLVGDSPRGLFNRYWFVLWDNSKWILWTTAKRAAVPPNSRLISEKSGIARIGFTGDAGPSTPVAALAQFKQGNQYFCIERFKGSRALFFAGQKIPKPKTVQRPKKK